MGMVAFNTLYWASLLVRRNSSLDGLAGNKVIIAQLRSARSGAFIFNGLMGCSAF